MRKIGYLMAIPALALGVGCTHMTPIEQSTLSGAAIGTVGGAAIGGLSSGSAGAGAVIGGATGAVVGNIHGQRRYRR